MDTNQPISTEAKAGSKFNLFEFVRETRREINKVTWPSRKETLVTTVWIVGMAIAVGLFFFVIDYLLGIAISHILGMAR